MSNVQNQIKIRSMCCGTLVISTKGRVDKRKVAPGDLILVSVDSETPQFHIYFRKLNPGLSTVNIK